MDDLINPPANQQVWVINSTYEPIQNVVVKVRDVSHLMALYNKNLHGVI